MTMRGYWVGLVTDDDVTTLKMWRVGARRLDSLCDQLRKQEKEDGLVYRLDVWYSKDNQTSGEAPIFTNSSDPAAVRRALAAKFRANAAEQERIANELIREDRSPADIERHQRKADYWLQQAHDTENGI